jgi:hypothetical protein
MVASSSELYGPVGVVFAVLVWLLVFGRLAVYAAVVEVVVWEKRHGTVTLTIEAPARPGVAPTSATRAGEQRFPRPAGGPSFPFGRHRPEAAPSPAGNGAADGIGDGTSASGPRSGRGPTERR